MVKKYAKLNVDIILREPEQKHVEHLLQWDVWYGLYIKFKDFYRKDCRIISIKISNILVSKEKKKQTLYRRQPLQWII